MNLQPERDARTRAMERLQPWWRAGVPAPLRYKLTDHARQRMHRRGISQEAIEATMLYGRVCQGRIATLYVLSRREVDWLYGQGLDLAKHEGMRVVCCGRVILTVYRTRGSYGVCRTQTKL